MLGIQSNTAISQDRSRDPSTLWSRLGMFRSGVACFRCTGGVVDGVPLQMRVIVGVEIEPGKFARFDAFTLVVNAHGGLFETTTRLAKGQKLLLSNPSVELKERATVIAVRRADGNSFDVAFEFDSPAPHFWPLAFPPMHRAW